MYDSHGMYATYMQVADNSVARMPDIRSHVARILHFKVELPVFATTQSLEDKPSG